MLHVQDKYGLWLANILKLMFILISMPNFMLPSSKSQLFSPMHLYALGVAVII